MRLRLTRVVDRITASRLRLAGVLGAVLLFLFAVRLLGAATNAAAPVLERAFVRVVVGDASTLGLGWLGAYALANGSIVAAVALSLFIAGLLTPAQLLLLVAGSRLGAAAIVVVVGVLDHVQNEAVSLRRSVSTGVLTFLVTHSVYLPATALGYVGLSFLLEPLRTVSGGWTVGARSPGAGALTAPVLSLLGPVVAGALAVALLFASLQLFDRLLASVDTETLGRQFAGRLRRTWVTFLVGLLVTTATTSVAFSLGIVVPLHNRGYVERDELVPYVLGANVGTLFDTLVVAVALASPAGLAVVLEFVGAATLVTLAALAVHGPYGRLVVAADERLQTDRRLFVAFALALLLTPLALLVVPLVT